MSTKSTIESWVSETAMDLIQNYTKMGLRASGKWAQDLETDVKEIGTGYRITFLGSAYTQQLVSGRRANKNQTKDSIRAFVGWAGSTFLAQWVKDKGLNISPFAVAYKIAREGIQVPNRFNSGRLLSEVFTDERIDKLLKDISMEMVDNMRIDFKTVFA